MSEIEQQLRAAMHRAVDAREAMPGSLIMAVQKRHRRRNRMLACLAALIIVAVAGCAAGAGLLLYSLSGLPITPGTNMQLLVPDPNGWAEWYSTATGTTTPIAGFPSDGGGDVAFGRVQGGFFVTDERIQGFCASYDCAGPAGDYYFVGDGANVATKIGAGLVDGAAGPWPAVVASGHAGAVWLTSYAHSSDNVATTSASSQLVSTIGQALGPRYQLPVGYLPEAGVGSYLLLDSVSTIPMAGPRVFLLWEPATNRVIRRIVDAFAAGPEQIAWTQGCRGCHLQILNVSTGKNVSTSIPAGLQTIWGYNASFSDNGQLLEYRPVTVGSSFTLPDGAVDVISTTSPGYRLLAVIPALSTSRWTVVHWLAGGPTLLVADGRASVCVVRHHIPCHLGPGQGARNPNPPTQVGVWQPGDGRVHVASVPANRGEWLESSAG